MEKVFSKIVIIIITTLTLLLAVSGCKTSKQAAKPVHKDTPTKLPATIKNLEGDEKRLVNEALTCRQHIACIMGTCGAPDGHIRPSGTPCLRLCRSG